MDTYSILYNILLTNKDHILDQILNECQLLILDDFSSCRGNWEDVFEIPRPMDMITKERTLLEDMIARDDVVDYLVNHSKIS